MVIAKKWKTAAVLLTLCLLCTALLAGCDSEERERSRRPRTFEVNDPASVFRLESAEEHVLCFGLSEEQVEQMLGFTVLYLEYDDSGVVRHQYFDHDTVFVDFLNDEVIVALRVESEPNPSGSGYSGVNEMWWAVVPTENGDQAIKIGTTEEDAKALFQPSQYSNILNTRGDAGVGFTVSYGADFLPTEYSEDAPYEASFVVQNGVVIRIVIQDNSVES